MKIKEQIMKMPIGPGEQFTARDVSAFLNADGSTSSSAVVFNALSALVSSGRLVRISPGVYSKNLRGRQDFICSPDERIVSWNELLKKRFPFVGICIWDVKELTSLMQHIPRVRMTMVETPRDVINAVSQRLAAETDLLVMENPSEQELKKYALGREVVVIKPMVSQGPVTSSSGVLTPRIEKILVDILADAPFYYLRGSGTDYIYRNALEGFSVNRKGLMRYASRRKKQDEVAQIINRIEL